MEEKPPSLDEFLTALEPEDQPPTDDERAGWLMRKLVATEKTIAANAGYAETERRKITKWETLVNTPLQERAVWLRSALEQYALHVRDTEGRKTIILPHGTIETRQGQPRWEVYSKTEFEEWAQNANPHLLRVKYEPEMTRIKTALEATEEGLAVDPDLGIVIPGIRVHPAAMSATVKPN